MSDLKHVPMVETHRSNNMLIGASIGALALVLAVTTWLSPLRMPDPSAVQNRPVPGAVDRPALYDNPELKYLNYAPSSSPGRSAVDILRPYHVDR